MAQPAMMSPEAEAAVVVAAPSAEQAGELRVAAEEEGFDRNFPETAVRSCTVLIAFQEPVVVAPRLLVVLVAREEGSHCLQTMALDLTRGLRADCSPILEDGVGWVVACRCPL